MNIKYPVSGAYGFELKLPVTPAGSEIYFGDIPEIRGKNIKYIDILPVRDIPVKAMSGRDIVRSNNAYLTLTDFDNKQFLCECPCYSNFDISANEGRRMLINRVIDFTKTFVRVFDPDSLNNTKSFYLIFWYDDHTRTDTGCNTGYNRYVKRDIEPIELLTVSGFGNTFFPDNRIVANRKIRNILSYSYANNVLSPNGYPLISRDLFCNSYVTLKRGNYEIFKQIPLILFDTRELYFTLAFQNIEFDLTSSFVEFSDISLVEDNTSIFFNIEMEGI